MLQCLTPALSARGAEPGDSGDKALAGGVRSTVGTHAGLQRGAHRAGLVSVRCRWVKYPEGVETDTSMGKPGHAESLPKSRGYQPTSVRLWAGTLMVRRCRHSVPGDGGPADRRQADPCVSRVTRGGLHASRVGPVPHRRTGGRGALLR